MRPEMRAGVVVPFALVALIWGSTWLVIKDQIAAIPPEWTIVWRFLLASAAMCLLAWMRGESLRLPAGGQRLAVLIGLTQFCGNYQFVYQAEHSLTSGLVAVFYALLLVPNAALSRLFLGTPVTGRFMLGSLVAVGGIALLLLHEARMAPAQGGVLWGIVLSVFGLLAASAANVLQAGPAARRTSAVPLMAWSMIWGLAFDVVLAFVVAGPPVIDMRLSYLAGVAYLAIFGSVITFPLYFHLIRELGAGKAAYNGVATPVIAMLLSTLFEGYRWSLLAVAGAVLAMAGLIVALSARRPAR
ncbi:EamA-like transporter family protein [Novosphingobium sp. CF614]|uniref:DMT family transporter n=1 Tax=Novosphingobium sp. CF614 TaxID=1884364 RepID=UPI0008E588CF|nr:EamA family transporter [Novosphingobium sp. CF614]SFF85628.1 EamA-like transporter family protein [Novosphingobium sp. CF614]